MEKRKFLTKQFVRKNTNSFYYERSRKGALTILYASICIGIIVFAYIVHAYKQKTIDYTGVIIGITGTLSALTILVAIPMLVMMLANHLFPKKREAFMQEFINYNNEVTELVKIVINGAELKILTNPDYAKSLHEVIRKIENDYEWVTDASFDGEYYNEKGISLAWAYTNNLTHLAERLKDLGIKIVKLDDVSIENLVKKGAQISDEVVFAKISKILAVRSEAAKCKNFITKHLEERQLLKNEIDEYFATLTRPGLTFLQDS